MNAQIRQFLIHLALAGIILLNAPAWFVNPFGPRQIIAWMLLFGAIPVAIHGFWLLKQIGKPQQANRPLENGTDANAVTAVNFAFENTTTLVTIGAYRYIRHPLYASLLILGAGAWLKDISTPATLLFGIMAGCLYMTARMEEDENEKRFGQSYTDYMRKTRMFIPYLF